MKRKQANRTTRFLCGILAAVCCIALVSEIAHASPGVVGTQHDLTVYTTGTRSGNLSKFTFDTQQVCVFCHTPHSATEPIGTDTYIVNNPSASGGSGSGAYQNQSGSLLLWNRPLSNAADYGGYATYQSSTLDADGGRVAEVRVYSLLCLSCHDGVGALNVMTNPPGESGAPTATGSGDQIGDVTFTAGTINPNIGERSTSGDSLYVELRNDHPVSFDYTPSHNDVASGGLVSPGTNGFVSDTNQKLRLFPNPHNGNRSSLECSTCHDPHNEGVKADGTYPFLVRTVISSAICLDCHLK